MPRSHMSFINSLARLQKGAAGFLQVEGTENPEVFHPLLIGSAKGGGH